VVVFVVYDRDEQLLDVVRAFRGELTATVHAEKEDGVLVTILVELLGERVGRLIFNGVPTGVAVTHAMQHGGPYPATTAPATTSVGMAAIDRFLRALAYQDAPDWVLPPALRDDNPLRIWRTVNGTLTDTTVAGASR
jgi:NADP-dependent aldehyde dehydrogenase